MKNELKLKGVYEGRKFKATHVYISKKIASCKENAHLNLKVGYLELAAFGCSEQQPDDTPTGYYICSGGQWVFVPFG